MVMECGFRVIIANMRVIGTRERGMAKEFIPIQMDKCRLSIFIRADNWLSDLLRLINFDNKTQSIKGYIRSTLYQFNLYYSFEYDKIVK